RAALDRIGFEIEPSGKRTFWVKSAPQIFAYREPLEILKEVIRELSSWGANADLEKAYEPLLKVMACRGSIQAHRPLGREEARSLLAELRNCNFPSNCPHGRPTLIRITVPELEKMFGRK
ncbi:MAG TPA: DNA mismatch repair protein MutL, partial [Thermodesulfobacteriota bacterium]|nr:DNA mismatch repair protein MutL [Thermodesulfobacteriota bacterium]